MKKTFLIIILALASLFVQAQTIDVRLSEEMNRRAEDEKIEVFVLMKAQYDCTQLCRQADFFVTKAERKAFVINELKAFTEASQYDLKQTLSEMERRGLTTSAQSIWTANAIYFTATKAAIQDLAQRPDIKTIAFSHKQNLIPETERGKVAEATRETTQNVLMVNADKVWELGYRGEGVLVSVVDSGVNYNHLDVADHLWDGGEEFPLHGIDIVNGDLDPMDDLDHGTHCAGTVLGDGTAGSLTGVAPEATLMCVKSIDSTGFGGAVNISRGMEWSVEHGCDLISMSLGMSLAEMPDKELLRRTCESVLDAGIVAAVCAGNEGHLQNWGYGSVPDNVRVPASCPPPYLDPDQQENPGGLTCVIAVGAVDYNDVAAYFTCEGPVTWQDSEYGDYPYNPGIGLIRPDVSGPGVAIKSLNYLTNDGYTNMDGTSMATPCVAGIIALMLQKNPELSPADICRILEETSVKLTPTKSNLTGCGRVDALAAVDAVEAYDGLDEGNVKANIYPNPTKDVVNIECEGMTNVKVFSMDGKLVKVFGVNGSQCKIDDLESGIYLIMIETDRGASLKKIVKL